jgi:hypothetical protein
LLFAAFLRRRETTTCLPRLSEKRKIAELWLGFSAAELDVECWMFLRRHSPEAAEKESVPPQAGTY